MTKKSREQGWKDGPAVNSTCCSYRGTWVLSTHMAALISTVFPNKTKIIREIINLKQKLK